MKIYAYSVEQNGPRRLESLARELYNLPLGERFLDGMTSELRLEELSRQNNLLLLDFAKAREGHGPGRMAHNAPLAEFDMREGENFGEDTAMVYDPRTGYATVQYNHYGPRLPSIERYLYTYDLSLGGRPPADEDERDEDRYGYEFGAVLKPNAYRRLRQFGIFREIEYSVAVPGILPGDRDAGRALGDVLVAPLPDGIETITVSMKANATRGSRLARPGAMGIIDSLRQLGDDVTRAIVRGRQGEQEKVEQVDLVEDRLMADFPIRTGAGRRYAREDRWGALMQVMQVWLDEGSLRVAP